MAISSSQSASIEVHRDFAAVGVDASGWAALAARGDTNTVFQSWHWQSVWWESFGRGELAIIVARAGGSIRAIAPLFIDSRMAYLVGSGGQTTSTLSETGKPTISCPPY